MGISLLDCIDTDIDRAAEKIYQKIKTKAKDLVAVGDEIAAELGIPIVNKRVSVTPISLIGAATDSSDYVPLAKALDKAAKEIGVDFIGGFSALVQKGYQKGDEILINARHARRQAAGRASYGLSARPQGIGQRRVIPWMFCPR